MKNRMLLAAVVSGLGLVAGAQEADYVGQKTCKMCHNKQSTGEQWHKWKETKHAAAYAVLSTDAAKQLASKVNVSTPPAETPDCLRCHITGYDAEKKSAPAEIAKEDGVQCESCHGPASDHLAFGKAMMKKDADKDAPKHIVKPAAETCIACHNYQSPAWDPNKYTTDEGSKTGFVFEQAVLKIAHPNPEKKQQATETK